MTQVANLLSVDKLLQCSPNRIVDWITLATKKVIELQSMPEFFGPPCISISGHDGNLYTGRELKWLNTEWQSVVEFESSAD